MTRVDGELVRKYGSKRGVVMVVAKATGWLSILRNRVGDLLERHACGAGVQAGGALRVR